MVNRLIKILSFLLILKIKIDCLNLNMSTVSNLGWNGYQHARLEFKKYDMLSKHVRIELKGFRHKYETTWHESYPTRPDAMPNPIGLFILNITYNKYLYINTYIHHIYTHIPVKEQHSFFFSDIKIITLDGKPRMRE